MGVHHGRKRIIKLSKRMDFECHQMEHQLGAYLDCSHGAGLAVLHPVYYRHIYKEELEKFQKFAVNVWGISPEGKTEEELARAEVEPWRILSVRSAFLPHCGRWGR